MGGLYTRFARHLGAAAATGLDLGQGGTPLVPSRSIGPKAGIAGLHFKLENLNPTGSYKDRFAGLAIGGLAAAGRPGCVATSSGNTGAALAAFSAAAGLRCALYVSENAPAGKLTQMLAYGAEVLRVRGFSIDAAESARISDSLTAESAARDLPIFITAYAVSPGPMEGIKTISYEIAEDLPGVSDVFAPAGGGGLYVAIARGFADLGPEAGPAPRMHIVQPAGNDTMVTPLLSGADEAREVSTSTRISGLGVGYVLDGTVALGHARATGGTGQLIDEDAIFALQRRLAVEDGLLVEPAGAVAVAGALQAAARGELAADARAVCILTGHAFKDPDSLSAMAGEARLIGRQDIPASFAGQQ
ncbi:pyridoxal-phosphate dependent enzyme [Pseudoroseicyclus tamaricis]|uniref:Pyridoxal-phosphate dependent enzyme n=1 Tax=Pseudoroseicyclus tamaricis TaxID=2705421 RepID=A0A6B2JQH1_9RHOB|nr:pyridoxal-phosphate dependent enzyme [Pseudoroseicyclus tamaricis]NDV00270.1 pyridoxal-phosphate dependent enzyme [Pseudoroseicyclus tamaricis]